mgnify:CR=1 FL=1
MDNAHYQITSEEDADPEDVHRVRQGLSEYNLKYAPEDNYHRVNLFIRDGNGEIAGGLLGETFWRWLHVDILWISDELRGQGYGTHLIQTAEDQARQNGCLYSSLDTMDFQALPFYEKLGYSVFGVLEDMPPGHKRYFLRRTL